MRARWIAVFGVLITPDHAPPTDGSRGGADNAKGAGAARRTMLTTTPRMSASRGTRKEWPACIADTLHDGRHRPLGGHTIETAEAEHCQGCGPVQDLLIGEGRE